MRNILKVVLGALCMTSFTVSADEQNVNNEKGQEHCQKSNESMQVLISEKEIQHKISEYAKILDEKYADEGVTIVMVMKGAVCFTADLIRNLNVDVGLEYIRCSSYGDRGKERGDLIVKGIDDLQIEGKNVLVVDDICDSGYTLKGVTEQLKARSPKSIETMTLLVRKSNAQAAFSPSYSLFTIENNAFVVGYGLDYKEKYRGLPDIKEFVQS